MNLKSDQLSEIIVVSWACKHKTILSDTLIHGNPEKEKELEEAVLLFSCFES